MNNYKGHDYYLRFSSREHFYDDSETREWKRTHNWKKNTFYW